MCPFSQINSHLMITINKGIGLISGITATASYLLYSYSKKTKKAKKNQNKKKPNQTKKTPNKQKSPPTSLHTFIMSHLSRKPETTNCTCAELTTS